MKIIYLLTFFLLSSSFEFAYANPETDYTVIVHGDPLNYILPKDPNTKIVLNKKSFITSENFRKFENYSLDSVHFVRERRLIPKNLDSTSKETPLTPEELAVARDKTLKPYDIYNFEIQNYNDAITFKFASSKFNHYDDFIFVEKKGLLELVGLERNGEVTPAKVLHYSIKKDGSAFSFLTYSISKTEGKLLTAYRFVKKTSIIPTPKTNDIFAYSYGNGVKVKWQEPIEVVSCTGNAAADKLNLLEISQDAVAEWNKKVKNLPTFSVKAAKSCPPFSDVNHHGIYYVKSYVYDPDPAYGSYAYTLNLADKSKKTLIDSDIIIYRDEVQKNFKDDLSKLSGDAHERLKTQMRFFILHELGHTLGIEHQFNPNIPTVMAYDENRRDSLQPYDIDAVTELYR